MSREIGIRTAKEHLRKIDEFLSEDHLLIGGLAVQQYHITRDTKDIDLVCEHDIAVSIIEKLFPAKDFKVKDTNDDEYRPAFIITDQVNDEKIVFFGPKILERDNYEHISLRNLLKESEPYKYRSENLKHIKVPQVESLAFIKLLAFLSRINKNHNKGIQDLIDFVNLTNNETFRINILINNIRKTGTEKIIHNQLKQLPEAFEIWNSSLLIDFFKIISPILSIDSSFLISFDDNYSNLYQVHDSIEFYEKIANRYDERNTDVVLGTHRQVINGINEQLKKSSSISILDIGSGTGRLIASQFFNNEAIQWDCIEPCSAMAKKFTETMQKTPLNHKIYDASIYDLQDLEGLNKDGYDVVIISLVLSSLPNDPDWKAISNLVKIQGRLIVTDFYESSPRYGFNYPDVKVALYTRRVQFIDILKGLMCEGLTLEHLDTIDTTKGEENTFIIEMIRK